MFSLITILEPLANRTDLVNHEFRLKKYNFIFFLASSSASSLLLLKLPNEHHNGGGRALEFLVHFLAALYKTTT